MGSFQYFLSSPSILLVTLLIFLYLIGGVIYRLYLCPIAKIPGPRLAALTFWYEFWYDVVRKGKYTWKIEEMHSRYGPIVRINPCEVHINDPEFYDEVYVGPARRTEKWGWSANMFGTSQAAVGTVSHDLHRLRRSGLNPFFSKRSVLRLEPTTQANIDRLRGRLKEFAGTDTPVNLADAFTCLSADVIGAYAFGQSYDFLERKDFYPEWRSLMMDLSRSSHLMKQLGWVYAIMTKIPDSLLSILSVVHPLTRELFRLQNGITQQILRIKIEEDSSHEKLPVTDEHPTIFHDILRSKLPQSELKVDRLTEEGITIIGAGTVTTAHTLTTICYHLLANPSKLSRLRKEIGTLDSTDSGSTRWSKLEQLPYLSAVVSEGLRMSYGVSHRLQRINPDSALQYNEWTIPAGTPVSMTQMFIHEDPNIFTAPISFLPERWMPGATPDPTTLKRYLVPFSKGTRQCVGMNLAYAEIYLALGALFRPVETGGLDMELFETDRSDVDVAHDFFNPSPRLDSKGMRVLIR